MEKINKKKAITKMISKLGMKVASNDNNQACPMFVYQPKRPKSMKKGK